MLSQEGMVQRGVWEGLEVAAIQGGGVRGLLGGWKLLSQLPGAALPHRDF